MSRSLGCIDERKRQAVLQATYDLAAAQGDEFPLTEVSRRSGVSRQTIYNVFGGKTGLLAELSRRTDLECPDCGPFDQGPLLPFLEAYAAALLEWAWDERRRVALGLRRRRPGEPQPATACDVPERRAVTALAGALARRERAGELQAEDITAAAWLFFDLVLAAPRSTHLFGDGAQVRSGGVATAARRAARLFARGHAPAARLAAPPILAKESTP